MKLDDRQKREILTSAKTIAIVGLSPDTSKASYEVASFLQHKGYDILPIYPRGGVILGKRAYISLESALQHLAEQGRVCDIINVFRKSEALEEVMREIIALRNLSSCDLTHLCVWIQLGLHHTESARLAKEHGIAYEEDSCIQLEYLRVIESMR